MNDIRFAVGYTASAQDDLLRFYEFELERARHAEDLQRAQGLIDSLREHVEGRLSRTPYLYRHAPGDQTLRELVIPGPGRGYVALYDIVSPTQVVVIAVRHQLEDDYL